MITPELFKQKIAALIPMYNAMHDAVTLQDKVRISYCKMILDAMTILFATEPLLDEELINNLKNYLGNNFSLFHTTSVFYTTMPMHDVTNLLCDLASWISEQTKLPVIQVLFPDVSLEPVNPLMLYPYLDNPDIRIHDVIKTHIISSNGHYLIPVACLSKLKLLPETGSLVMPYFDLMTHEHDLAYLNKDEFRRLADHSPLTRAIVDAKSEYDTLVSDMNTLLGQLNQLCQQLANNSEGGSGTAEASGKGAYYAIICFMDYYQQLSGEKKAEIPHKLKKEIENLLTLGTDAEENAENEMETCIATRRRELITEMTGHEERLNTITLDQNKIQSLVNNAKMHFNALQKELLDVIHLNNYTQGSDKLYLDITLVDYLGIPLQIEWWEDLDIFQSLSASEISSILQVPELRQQITTQIVSIGSLVVFATMLSAEKLAVFLESMSDELLIGQIEDSSDISELLVGMDIERFQVISRVMKQRITTILTSTEKNDFINLLELFRLEQLTVLCHSMGDSFGRFIQSADDFNEIIMDLPPEKSTILFNMVKSTIHDLIKTGDDVLTIMDHLSIAESIELCSLVEERWPTLLEPIDAFTSSLEYQERDKITAVYNSIKDMLPAFIKSSKHFQDVMSTLLPEQRTEILNTVNERVHTLIQSAQNVHEVIEFLLPNQRTDIFHLMRTKLPEFITSSADFQWLACFLPEQRTEIFNDVREKLPQLVQADCDFHAMLKCLSLPERIEVFNLIMQSPMTTIIKSAKQFQGLIEYLPQEHRDILFNHIRVSLPSLIQSVIDFKQVLFHLSPIQRWDLLIDVDTINPGVMGYLDSPAHSPSLYPMNMSTESITSQKARTEMGEFCRLLQEVLLHQLNNNVPNSNCDLLNQPVQAIFNLPVSNRAGLIRTPNVNPNRSQMFLPNQPSNISIFPLYNTQINQAHALPLSNNTSASPISVRDYIRIKILSNYADKTQMTKGLNICKALHANEDELLAVLAENLGLSLKSTSSKRDRNESSLDDADNNPSKAPRFI